MRLPSLPLIVLDTETTGFMPRVHHIIEFASVKVEGGKVIDEYETLIDVKEEIPPHIQVLTRIKQEAMNGQPVMDDVRQTITDKLAGPALLVGQNLGFDLSMLKGDGIDLTDRPWIDTSLLASLAFPELRSYSLKYLSETLGLRHDPVHRALGDVRATLELLSHIWERLCKLPKPMRLQAKDILSRSTEGYRLLAAEIPEDEATEEWMFPAKEKHPTLAPRALDITMPSAGEVALEEEPLQADHLQSLVASCAADASKKRWIAVKNLEATLRKVDVPDGAVVLHPPFLLLDPKAAETFLAQPSFTADEATLAIKLAWFKPQTKADVAVHGGEKDVWNGKLACTEHSEAYTAQFRQNANAYLLDHRQLLHFLPDPTLHTQGMLTPGAHVIIDDASMLEDTATKAYGHFVSLDDLRAASQGNDTLMRLVDVITLWTEKARGELDVYYVKQADLQAPETTGMLKQITEYIADTTLSGRMRQQLEELAALLDPAPNDDLTWIEKRINGSLFLQSAPEHVDRRLAALLFDAFPTTLLVPGGEKDFPETLPPKYAVKPHALENPQPGGLTITCMEGFLQQFVKDPLPGKTIILAPSKHLIEKIFIEHTEVLEARGVTLICQGLSGGMNRMEAEFLAAEGQAIMVLTCWMYEGSELPEGVVDHLIIDTLPFDNPANPIFAKRKDHHGDSFAQYSLPRLRHRMFRLVRTFCKHRTASGDIRILDKRVREKSYGAKVCAYLKRFGPEADAERKPVKEKGGEEKPQLKLF